ncbi:Gfo/Idh/MocA family oxidoreductase [Lactobacillus sp. S2-2]|uniref:Gfo/Idh/MocA family protein n=1 Tax=Lactobacillus sp. S2-2 TaxID=2692917 RepID=UPI001F201FA3|nr:Gfo/Idh/MocA family oxidoreductase [Lactobacillus sp. S2-2]MCF6514815.1 Gfo/Idh/MocA family oxidoreductase [Lactobacillus sp. S2-2]
MIKVGTIGTSWITDLMISAMKSNDDYEITAVYSRNKSKDYALKHTVKNYYDDLNLFFKSNVFDTVYIASPNSLHFEQVKLAIKNNKNIIVEKPAFSNPEEFFEIEKLLKEKPNILLFEATRNTHTKNFKQIKKIVDKNEITSANFIFANYSSRYDQLKKGMLPNVFNPKFNGGALQDMGVYPVSTAVSLFGKPTKVKLYSKFLTTGVDGEGTAILQYPKFKVMLFFSKISTSYQLSEIYLLNRTVTINNVGDFNVTDIRNKDLITNKLDTSSENVMDGEISDFARIIKNPKENMIEYQNLMNNSRITNQVINDLYKSINKK